MARIVSGAPQQGDTNFALLQGTQIGREWGRAAREKEEIQRRVMAEMLEAQASYQKNRAKLYEEAVLGDEMARAQVMQQEAMRAQYGLHRPEMAQLENIIGAIGHAKTEEGRNAMMAAADDYGKALNKYQGYLQANEQLQMASQDPVFQGDPRLEDWNARLGVKQAAGEPADDILTELTKAKDELTEHAQVEKEALLAQQQAQALVDVAPPSQGKTMAEKALWAYQNFSSARKDISPGKLLMDVVGWLNPKESQGDKNRRMKAYEAQRKRAAHTAGDPTKPAPGLEGMTLGEMKKEISKEPERVMWDPLSRKLGISDMSEGYAGGPEIPPYKQPRKKGEQPKKLPEGPQGRMEGRAFVQQVQKLYQATPNLRTVMAELERLGYDIDDPELGGLFEDAIASIHESAAKQPTRPR